MTEQTAFEVLLCMHVGGFLSALTSVASKALPFLAKNAPTIISAGSNLIGGIVGAEGAEDANNANIALSRENRDWQERMANTAHQREVADLRAAGINPILSAKFGGSATPPGNVAQLNNAMEPVAGGIHSAVATRLQSDMNREQILTQRSVQSANSAQAMASRASAIKSLIDAQKIQTEIPATKARSDKEKAGQWYRNSWMFKNIWKPLGDTFETINPFKVNFKGND